MCKCGRCGFDYRYIEKNIGCTHKHGCFERENEELAFAAIDEILNKSKKNKISYEEILKILDKYDLKVKNE